MRPVSRGFTALPKGRWVFLLLVMGTVLISGSAQAAPRWDRASGSLYQTQGGGATFDSLGMDPRAFFLEWARQRGVSGSLAEWKDTLPWEESLTSGCTEYRLNEFTLYDTGTPERGLEVYRRMLESGFSPQGLRWRRNTLFECWPASAKGAPEKITAQYREALESLVDFFDSAYVSRASKASGLKTSELTVDQSALGLKVPVTGSITVPAPPPSQAAPTTPAPGYETPVPASTGLHPVAEMLSSQGYKPVTTPWGELPCHYAGQGKSAEFNLFPQIISGARQVSWVMGVTRGSFNISVDGSSPLMVLASAGSFSRSGEGFTLSFESLPQAGGAFWGVWKLRLSDKLTRVSGSSPLDRVIVEPSRGCWVKILASGLPGTGATPNVFSHPGSQQQASQALKEFSDPSTGMSLTAPGNFSALVESSGTSVTLNARPLAGTAEPLNSLRVSITSAPFAASSSPEQIAAMYEKAQLQGMTLLTSSRQKGFDTDVLARVYRSTDGKAMSRLLYFWTKNRIHAARVDYSPTLFDGNPELLQGCFKGFGASK